LAFVADFGTQNFNLKTKFDMENKTSTNHDNGNDANRLLAAVFLSELADLMEKHKATLIIERVWDGEYDSHAELDFMVNGIFIEGGFYASPLKELKSDDIRKLS
jgi:hypothetical protein